MKRFQDRMPLEDIKAPTLLVHGKKDEIVPYSHTVDAHTLIPNAELCLVETGTHFLAGEQVAD